MPVRANLERPDYIGGVGQALGGIASTVDQLSPMDSRLQRAIFEVIGGGDPKQVAAALRGGMQAPEMPSSTPPMPSGQQTAPNVSRTPVGTAAQAPKEPPLAPFARRDAPTLMQLAQMTSKKDPMADALALERLGLQRDALGERRRQFDEQSGLRDAREALARATAEGIPERIELARKNYQARLRSLGISEERLGLGREQLALGQRRLLSGELEKVLRATSGARVAAETFETLLNRAKDPKNVPGEFDYDLRRSAQMLSALPFGAGKLFEEGLEFVADDLLTPAQLSFRRQVALGMQDFIASNYGKTLTGNELKLARQLAGQQMSIKDTIAGLEALKTHMQNKINMYSRAYPEASDIVGEPDYEMPALSGEDESGPSQGIPSIPLQLPTMPRIIREGKR